MDRAKASELKALRRQVMRMQTGRGRRYPGAMRARAVEVVDAARASGWSWERLSAAIGISGETLRRWRQEQRQQGAPALAPVVIADDDPDDGDGLLVVTPSGYRVEGLSVDEAARLLRALS